MDRTSSFRRTLMRCLFQGAIVVVPSAALAVAGCSGGVTTGSGGGSNSSSNSSSSSTGSDGGACSTDNPCPQGSGCVFQQGSCQKGATGVCRNVFQCDGPPSGPLCRCDGNTLEAEYAYCVVGMMSLPYDNTASCQVGTFPCGPTLQCKRNAEVCVETIPGVPGPPSYACIDHNQVKGWCLYGIPDCACIDTTSLGAPMNTTCKADADHQETVTVALP